MALQCQECGFNNPPGMRFCGNCGTRLEIDLKQTGRLPLSALVGADLETTAGQELLPENMGILFGADLQERFLRAGLESAGQRRDVTVLFADISGYTHLSTTMDSEDVYELVQQFVKTLANCVYKYEGIVDKITGDGLMALFGAPIAHENNAERAARAALDMQAEIRKLNLELDARAGIDIKIRIGLHAGTVVVGGIGSNLVMDYTAIGDTVNLAHRIEEAARPGSVLASETVFRQTRALFEFEPTPELNLKGIPQPVTAYVVQGLKQEPGLVRGIQGLSAPMIGRDAELNRLTSIVEDLAARKMGHFILVIGEAGIGKSRLSREFKAKIAGAPLRVLEAQSLAYRRSVSYWIFYELLHHLLGVSHPADETYVKQRLTQVAYRSVGGRAGEILPYLEHLLSLPLSDPNAAERIGFLDASQLRQQIFLAVRDLFLAETEREPLVLILDDLHWADEASLELLTFLVDSIRHSSLTVLGITRPFKEGLLGKLHKNGCQTLADRCTTIYIESLSVDQSDELFNRLLSISDLPTHLREQIIQRAEGVPFYLEEILRMLIDNGLIRKQADGWRYVPSEDGAELGVPDTLRGLILARFDRLPAQQRRVLESAATIGNSFSLPLLKEVLAPIPDETFEQGIHALTEREFILPRQQTAHSEYVFRHMLMSEAVYSTLLRRERARLHGIVGEAIETIYANRLDEQVELLARHYSWSPRLDRALHYLILAGQKATRGYLNQQGQQHFEAALALLPQIGHTPRQALEIHTGLGDLLALSGDYPQARQRYLTALDCIPDNLRSEFISDLSTLQRKIGTTHERQGDYERAIEWLESAENELAASSLDNSTETAQILSDRGWVDFRRGNLDAAEEILTRALALSEESNRFDVIASINNRLGGVYFAKDMLDQAGNYVRKSLVLREEIGDILGVARSYNNLGLLGWRKGDWNTAVEDFTRCLELNQNLGDVEGLVHLHSNIGLLQTDRGNLKAAREHLEESLHVAQEIGHSFLEALACMHLSRYWLAECEWQLALEYSHRSLQMFDEIGAHENLADLYISIGEAYLGLNNLVQAGESGRKALELTRQLHEGDPGPSPEQGRALRLLGNVARLENNLEQANAFLRESQVMLSRLGNQLELGRTLVAMALLERARNDRRAFRLHTGEARLIFRHLDAALDLRQLDELHF